MRRKSQVRRLHTDERGVSMVLIIVLIAFLSILLSVLMTTTMFNYQMKLNAVRERNNFYAAEKELEEVRLALAKEVSGALRDSYRTAMETPFETEQARWAAFEAQYLSDVEKRLSGVREVKGIAHTTYDDRIVLEDIALSHTDAEGFTTSLTCDIAILVPNEAYRQTHGVMEVKDLVVYEGFTSN